VSEPVNSQTLSEALRRASVDFGEAVLQVCTQLQPIFAALGEEAQRTIAVLDQGWPGWRKFAASVGEHEPEPPYQGCHCLCAIAHGGLGVCNGEAEPDLFVTGRLGGERHDIPVCRACFEAKARVLA
jgi:hypothetical protein